MIDRRRCLLALAATALAACGQRPTVDVEGALHQFGECRRVSVKEASKSRVRSVLIATDVLPLRPVRVERTHPDREHLFAIIRKPLNVDYKPTQPIHQP